MENPNKDAIQEQVGLSMQASQQMNGSRIGSDGNTINLNAPMQNQTSAGNANTKIEAPPPNILFSLMNGNQQQVNQTLGNNMVGLGKKKIIILITKLQIQLS